MSKKIKRVMIECKKINQKKGYKPLYIKYYEN